MMGIYNLAADILTQYFTVGLDSAIAYLNSTAVAQGEVDACWICWRRWSSRQSATA